MAATLQHQAAREFARALKCAKKSAAKGKPELAVDWCRYGASIAWSSNPGFVYSHEMELLLAEIRRKTLSPVSAPAFSDGPLHRFLHVMTAAYERGGHTRAVSRSMRLAHSMLRLSNIDLDFETRGSASASLVGSLRPKNGWRLYRTFAAPDVA